MTRSVPPANSTAARDAGLHDAAPGWLFVVCSPTEGLAHRALPVGDGALVVGRIFSDDRGLSLSGRDRSASRRHCVMERSGDRFFVRDAGSSNGTFVNGSRLGKAPTLLADGDVVRAGQTLMVFRSGAAPREQWEDALLPGRAATLIAPRAALTAAASGTSPLLLVGEAGVGKQTAASRLHALGPRAGHPFVPVHCAELSRPGAAVDLLGGAGRRGLLGLAEGGTLFLEEVGLLDLEVQGALLRVLEAGFPNVRLVASTSADLYRTAGRGAFLPALLERLAVVRLPALRERPEDIVPLARDLAASRAADAGLIVEHGWDADFTEALLLFPFPRNLRELGDAMLTASLNARGSRSLTLRHLPEAIRAACCSARQEAPPTV